MRVILKTGVMMSSHFPVMTGHQNPNLVLVRRFQMEKNKQVIEVTEPGRDFGY